MRTQPLSQDAVDKFSKLWRAYFNSYNAAFHSWQQLMINRQGEDWENPLLASDVQISLKNWQNAVVDAPGAALFGNKAQQHYVLDPRPVIAHIRLTERVPAIWDGVESIFLSDDLSEAQRWLRAYSHRTGISRSFVQAGTRTRVKHEDILYDQTYKVPLNLIRYVCYRWRELTDEEKQRSIEVLAGWVKANTKSRWLPIERGYVVNDELKGELALKMRDFFPPNISVFTVTSSTQAARYRGHIATTLMPRTQQWCKKFASAVVNQLVSTYRLKGKNADFDLSEMDEIPAASDGIQEFYALEDAKSQIEKAFPYLTQREQQICALKATGMTQREVAKVLEIGFETVNELLDRARKRTRGELPPCRAYRQANKSKRASPKSASPKSASPKSASPKSASPKSASPKNASKKYY